MNEIEILSNCILKNLSKYGTVTNIHDEEVKTSVTYSLDDTAFTVCKALIDFGMTKQEENNQLALEILGKSIIEAVPMIKDSSGKYQNLFYSWINSQSSPEEC